MSTFAGFAVSAGTRLFASEIMGIANTRSFMFNGLDMAISFVAFEILQKNQSISRDFIVNSLAGRSIGFVSAHLLTALLIGSGGPLWFIAECIMSVAGVSLGLGGYILMGQGQDGPAII